MYRFSKKYHYDGENEMDPEVVDLCNIMNSLPGVKTTESCSGHGVDRFRIFFRVTDEKGLFFLTRCVDNRYWKYGYLWQIDLSVGDMMKENGVRPIIYQLHSGPIVGEDAYNQAQDLIKNMNDHLNIPVFLEYFKLQIEDFDI